MDKTKKSRSNKYFDSALMELSKAKPYYLSYFEIKDNNLLNAAAGLLGFDVNNLYPPDLFIDPLGRKEFNEYSIFEVLEHISRLKARLIRLGIALDDIYEKIKNASMNNDDNNTLLIEAREVIDTFIKNHDIFVSHIERTYIFLTLQFILDVKEENVENIRKEAYEIQENCISDILFLKKNTLEELENKSGDLEEKNKELNYTFQLQEEKIHNIAQSLIEQIDKNFSTQQRINLDSVTKQTRVSINEIQLSAQKSTDMFHELLDSKIGNISNRIDKEVGQFESHKLEIQGILGDISNAHQSNANRIQADKEKATADSLRLFGVLGLIFVIFFSLYLFNSYLGFFGANNTSESQLTAQWFLVRFFTITLLTGPFIYLLKESASHRNKENLYRQRGTQLSSIGAYLSELDIQERTLLKKELARNFFSFHDVKSDTQNVPDFLRDMKQFVGIARTINSPQKTASERLRRK